MDEGKRTKTGEILNLLEIAPRASKTRTKKTREGSVIYDD